ncbi:unnamed protein product [Urochloa humidicola]
MVEPTRVATISPVFESSASVAESKLLVFGEPKLPDTTSTRKSSKLPLRKPGNKTQDKGEVPSSGVSASAPLAPEVAAALLEEHEEDAAPGPEHGAPTTEEPAI